MEIGSRELRVAAVFLVAAMTANAASIVTRLPTQSKVVALTFDACEAKKVAHLDEGILEVLRHHPVPFTVFVSGRFVRDNEIAVAELSRWPEVHIENHSWSHPADMRLLSDDEIRREVLQTDDIIERVAGRRPTFFRFPGGLADERTVDLVARLGHQTVHWRWPEGDPARAIDANALIEQTYAKVRPGDILIFHINGRGWHTAEALPELLTGLELRGYRFVSLVDALSAPAPIEGRESKKAK
jgi:peptidoglycan/xylan/chitin deacetylase (PgdA/CDA1 family)